MAETTKAEAKVEPAAPDRDLPLSSDASKDPTKRSRFDHGKPSKEQLEQEKLQADFLKDPWGFTPAQQRV